MPTPTLRTEAFTRGAVANTSATSFAISANGLMTQATLDALTIPKIGNDAGSRNAAPMRGVRVVFFGTAADNTTHSWRVYGAWKIDGNAAADVQYYVGCLAYGTFTLSTAVGLKDASAIKTTERIADTIVVTGATGSATTPKGPGTFINDLFGGVLVNPWSPADDTPAVLGIKELGNPSYILMDLDAASDDINAVFARDI